MTATAAPALKVYAAAHSTYLGEQEYRMDYSRPLFVEIATADYATEAEAAAVVALFPKSAKFYVSRCSHAGGIQTYSARTRATLVPTGNNGGTNETGVRRYRSIMARAEKLGASVEFVTGRTVNAYADRETFEAAIA